MEKKSRGSPLNLADEILARYARYATRSRIRMAMAATSTTPFGCTLHRWARSHCWTGSRK